MQTLSNPKIFYIKDFKARALLDFILFCNEPFQEKVAANSPFQEIFALCNI